jgi:hypothetical protein
MPQLPPFGKQPCETHIVDPALRRAVAEQFGALKAWENVPQIKSENTIVIRKGGTKCSLYLKDVFQVFHEELLMSNTQNHPQAGANEAPKTPAPGVATPAPQQNQGDKPANKPSEQQK